MTDSAETPITAELRSWIGRKAPIQPLEIITATDVRRYVDATGDTNALWLDDEFARSVGYRGRLLPPTLVGWVPFSFKEGTERAKTDSADLRRQLPLPANYTNVRNAGSETEWLHAAYLGEQLSSQSSIVDIVARQGRAGLGIYISEEEHITNSRQELVMRRRHTMGVFPEKKFPAERKEAS